jgi:hypothetical protein
MYAVNIYVIENRKGNKKRENPEKFGGTLVTYIDLKLP